VCVPAPADTWRLRTPPGGVSVPSPLRGPDSIWGSGTWWEVRGPPAVWPSAPFSGTRGDPGPIPEREANPGLLARWDGVGPEGSGRSAPLGVVTDNCASLDIVRGGTLVQRYRHLASNFPFPSYAQYNELMAKMIVLEHLVKYTNLWDYFFHIFFFIFRNHNIPLTLLFLIFYGFYMELRTENTKWLLV